VSTKWGKIQFKKRWIGLKNASERASSTVYVLVSTGSIISREKAGQEKSLRCFAWLLAGSLLAPGYLLAASSAWRAQSFEAQCFDGREKFGGVHHRHNAMRAPTQRAANELQIEFFGE